MTSVVINYCSNEAPFLDCIIKQCLKFTDDIVISYGSHLYDGTPENHLYIELCKEKYPEVTFVCYNVDINEDLTTKKGVKNRPTAYWHNLARWTGIQALKKKEWVFIIDGDEVPEGALVKIWLEKAMNIFKEDECYKIATFWYFKDPTNRAKTLEDSILLMHYKHLTEDNIFGDYERDHLIPASKCALQRNIMGINKAILWHHFSFVRPKHILERKLRTWGHSNDIFKGANIEKIIEDIYKDDNVNDIVHNYQYEKVYNKFNIVI